MKKKIRQHSFFERFSNKAIKITGSTPAFLCAFALVIGWGLTGPLFHYSESWQLVINTGTTIITFLMVFVIQKAQNKDSLALQLKLNELLAASDHASNRLVDIEEMSEDELKILHQFYAKLAKQTQHEQNLLASHSIDEATKKAMKKILKK